MNKHTLTRAGASALCIGLAAIANTALSARAQDFSRAGSLEIFTSMEYSKGDTTGILNKTANIDFQDFIGGGIGIGYNLPDHLNVNLDWNLGGVNTKVDLAGARAKSDAFGMAMDVNLDCYILKSRFTPMLTGGMGYFYASDDVNVPGAFLNYSQGTFTMGGGGGIRWDIDDHLFLKAYYRANWQLPLDAFDNDMLFHSFIVMLGYRF